MKKILKLSILIIFCSILTFSYSYSQIRLKTKEFKKMLNTNKNYQLIDVRTALEVKDGIIKNSINIDLYSPTFESDIKKLDTNKMTFIYCSCGGRSEEAITLMSQWGFKGIFELEDGYNDWVKFGYPIEKIK